MKKFLATLFALTMVMSLAACGGSSSSDSSTTETSDTTASSSDDSGYTGGEYTLTLGHVVADDTPLDVGADYFAEKVSELSGGKITIEVYPNSALGDNRSMIEALQQGTQDIALPAVANLAAFTSATKLFDLPFLFKNSDHAEAFLDSEYGQGILDDLSASGLKGLSWWVQGWRELSTKDIEFHAAGDLNGESIRVQDNEIHIATWEALGGAPTTLAFSELFTALQQGTIDCEENPVSNIKLSGFYEVQGYVIKTDHVYDALPIIMSQKSWDNLDSAAQEVIQTAANLARDYERDYCYKFDEDILAEWDADENAPTVVYLTDDERAALREACQSVYDTYADEIGQDLIDAAESFAE